MPRRKHGWRLSTAVGVVSMVLIALAGTSPARAADAKPILIRLSTGLSPSSLRAAAVSYFADEINQKSNGRLKVQIFWSGSLGGVQRSAIDTVRAGGAEMTDISTSNFSAINRSWSFFDLPFLFKDPPSLYKYVDSPEFAALKEDTARKDGLRCVFTTWEAWRELITTKRPIHTPADMDGIKLRTTGSPVETAYDTAFGAKPTMVDWGETYLALKNGLVDGYVVPYTGVTDFNMDDAVKYGTTFDITPTPSPMFMSERFYRKLPPDLRKLVDDVSRQAELKGRQLVEQHLATAEKKLQGEGFVIYVPPPAVKAQWVAKAQPVYKQFATAFPQGMIEKIRAMQ
jgi:TRAP-type transport system periplasmic protein